MIKRQELETEKAKAEEGKKAGDEAKDGVSTSADVKQPPTGENGGKVVSTGGGQEAKKDSGTAAGSPESGDNTASGHMTSRYNSAGGGDNGGSNKYDGGNSGYNKYDKPRMSSGGGGKMVNSSAGGKDSRSAGNRQDGGGGRNRQSGGGSGPAGPRGGAGKVVERTDSSSAKSPAIGSGGGNK